MNKAHILVVDDEPVTRQSLTDILRLEGYTVSSVANGEAAVDYIRAYSVDLMLLDLRMPGMSGLEVIKVTTQLSPDTEIIMLTAHGSMETAVEALRQRIHDYLLKPASPAQVLDSVSRGLERRNAKLEARRTTPSDLSQSTIALDAVSVDLTRRLVSDRETTIQLTPAEGHLLKVFIENPGRVFSHRELVLLVQGYDVSQREAQEILRPLISRLRNKLEVFPTLHDRIMSVRGTGYLFESDQQVRISNQ
jgi:DNA-binding response OmpR family regulator